MKEKNGFSEKEMRRIQQLFSARHERDIYVLGGSKVSGKWSVSAFH